MLSYYVFPKFQASFDTFTHYKSCYVRDLGWLGEKVGSVRYPPFSMESTNFVVMKQLMASRKLPNLGVVGYAGTFLLGAAATFGGIVAGLGPVVKEMFM